MDLLRRTLAHEGDRARDVLLRAGTAEALVDMAEVGDCPRSRTAAALTLLSLAQGPASLQAVITAGSIR